MIDARDFAQPRAQLLRVPVHGEHVGVELEGALGVAAGEPHLDLVTTA